MQLCMDCFHHQMEKFSFLLYHKMVWDFICLLKPLFWICGYCALKKNISQSLCNYYYRRSSFWQHVFTGNKFRHINIDIQTAPNSFFAKEL